MKELIDAVIEAIRGVLSPQPDRAPVPVRADKPRNGQMPWKDRS
jgi:hypothetical protein